MENRLIFNFKKVRFPFKCPIYKISLGFCVTAWSVISPIWDFLYSWWLAYMAPSSRTMTQRWSRKIVMFPNQTHVTKNPKLCLLMICQMPQHVPHRHHYLLQTLILYNNWTWPGIREKNTKPHIFLFLYFWYNSFGLCTFYLCMYIYIHFIWICDVKIKPEMKESLIEILINNLRDIHISL